MSAIKLPNRVNQLLKATSFLPPSFAQYQGWLANAGPGYCDFYTGNPQEMPMPAFVDALQKQVEPQNKEWYAYKSNEPETRNVVAAALQQQFGRAYDPEDIFMTNGASGALMVALNTLVGEGDEVLYLSPPWFFYESYTAATGATPVKVPINWETFDLDLDAIEAAITPRTKAIIVNSPHNPTGKIYSPETLTQLAEILTQAYERYGHPIYLLSDEAYREVVYSGHEFTSPTSYYPYSLIIYTYGKTLLTPGQRLGYIAVSPEMPDREQLRMPMFTMQVVGGWAMASAMMQHAIVDLQKIKIDVEPLERRANFLIGGMREAGYDVHMPEGTFYLLPKSPIPDDNRFCEILAEDDVFCMPGNVPEAPGYFRICLTGNDEMVERALPIFEKAIRKLG